MYKEYKQFVDSDLFFRPFGDHGIGHTRRVLYLAINIAEKYDLSEKDKKVLAFACCYHDIGRTNDWTDDSHGAKSTEKVLYLRLNEKHNLSDDDLKRALELITFHSLDDEMWVKTGVDLLMYQILKDADALDRLRFDDLDTKYLRLSESKEMIGLELSLLKADGII
jgi:HD superfamily phosphodiesterase